MAAWWKCLCWAYLIREVDTNSEMKRSWAWWIQGCRLMVCATSTQNGLGTITLIVKTYHGSIWCGFSSCLLNLWKSIGNNLSIKIWFFLRTHLLLFKALPCFTTKTSNKKYESNLFGFSFYSFSLGHWQLCSIDIQQLFVYILSEYVSTYSLLLGVCTNEYH